MTTLKVDAGVLHSAGTSFGQVADGLGSLQADALLGDAAAAVPSLQTGAACLVAQSDVAAATTEVADGARQFSDSVATAARWYENRDQTAAEAITKIEIGEVAAAVPRQEDRSGTDSEIGLDRLRPQHEVQEAVEQFRGRGRC